MDTYALLADGTTVEIRRATPDDFDAAKAMHEAMSPDDIYLRFFSFSPRSAENEAERICRRARRAGSRCSRWRHHHVAVRAPGLGGKERGRDHVHDRGGGSGRRSPSGAWVTGGSCDHADNAAVAAVAHRIRAEQGRLDLLVNNVWGGYERVNAGLWEESRLPLWEQPVEVSDAMFTRGVRAHYVALAVCAPLLISTSASLVVTVSNASLRTSPEGVGRAVAAPAGDPDVLSLTGRRCPSTPSPRDTASTCRASGSGSSGTLSIAPQGHSAGQARVELDAAPIRVSGPV